LNFDKFIWFGENRLSAKGNNFELCFDSIIGPYPSSPKWDSEKFHFLWKIFMSHLGEVPKAEVAAR
jgi:hypothetical protein